MASMGARAREYAYLDVKQAIAHTYSALGVIGPHTYNPPPHIERYLKEAAAYLQQAQEAIEENPA